MKIKFQLFIYTILFGVMSACDTSEIENAFEGSRFVFFEQANISIGEAGTNAATASGLPVNNPSVAEIIVRRSSPNVSEPLTVTFSMSSQFVDSTDFANAGDDASETFIVTEAGQVVIPAGEYSTTFTLTAINDLLSSGDKVVTMEITGVSDPSYQIGATGGATSRNALNLTIADDDCPIDLVGDWEGTYTVEDVAPEGSANDGLSLSGSGFYSGDITLTADLTDPAGITAVLGNDGSATVLAGDIPMVFNTCPETVSPAGGVVPLGFTVNGSAASLAITRESTFDSGATRFVLRGNLINAGGINFGSWDFTFTKQ